MLRAVMSCALVLSSLAVTTSASARDRHRERQERRYEKRMAQVVAGGTVTDHGRPFRIFLGRRPISDWDFADKLSHLSGTPINPEMMAVYEPPGRRKLWIPIVGYGVGGMVAGFSTLNWLAAAQDPRACARDKDFSQAFCDERTAGRERRASASMIGTAVGGGMIAGTLLYHLLAPSGRDDEEPYFSQAEAERLAAEYNRLLRIKLGLDGAPAPKAGERPAYRPDADAEDAEPGDVPPPASRHRKSNRDEAFDDLEEMEDRQRGESGSLAPAAPEPGLLSSLVILAGPTGVGVSFDF